MGYKLNTSDENPLWRNYMDNVNNDEKWLKEVKLGLPTPSTSYGTYSEDELNIPKRAISLMFNMRSTDVPLGLPFNLASYGLLLEILGKVVNMVPDELIANLGDAHIYLNQIEGIKEQLTREPYELPTLKINAAIELYNFFEYLSDAVSSDFILENYKSQPAIKIPLSN